MSSISLNMQNRIVTILKGITKQAGYNNDIQKVTKRFIDMGSESQFPIACVLRGGWRGEFEDESHQLKRRFASFAIIIYAQSDSDDTDEGKLTGILDDLETDVCNILELNTDQLLIDTTGQKLLITSGESIMDQGQNNGALVIGVAIEYTHDTNL